MSNQPVISVRGEARLEVEPEIAVVSATAQARDRDRRTLFDRLARRNQKLIDTVRSYGEAIENLESQAASVYPENRKKRAEQVDYYAGRAGVTVTVRDFTVLGDLVASLADGDLVVVAGPWWDLRQDSPVHREVRLAAAREAMLRAREYAEAFGGRLTGLVEAADTGLLGNGEPLRLRAVAGFAGRGAGAAGEPAEMDFKPVRQTVEAQVEARFTMTQPEFTP